MAEFLHQIWKEGRTQNKVRAGVLEESKIAKHGDQGAVHTGGDESQERGKGQFSIRANCPPPGDNCQCLETGLVVTTRGKGTATGMQFR